MSHIYCRSNKNLKSFDFLESTWYSKGNWTVIVHKLDTYINDQWILQVVNESGSNCSFFGASYSTEERAIRTAQKILEKK